MVALADSLHSVVLAYIICNLGLWVNLCGVCFSVGVSSGKLGGCLCQGSLVPSPC